MKKVLGAGLVAVVLATAPMHLALTNSNPKADTTVETVPDTIQLWFNQELETAISRIALEGPDGRVEVSRTTHPTADGKSMAVMVEGATRAGTYEVAWRAAGDDGHPVRGSFTFTVSAER